MKNTIFATSLIAITALTGLISPSQAADYKVDVEGAHAFVQFKVKHLGYSWLLGRFNTFDGQFSYDEQAPNASKIAVEIDVTSIDSNHAERDKHLKGDDFLDVSSFPKANFVSSSITFSDDKHAVVKGNFTLKGVTKPISFEVVKIGGGKDPWGGYRMGFSGKTRLKMSDYGMTYDLGPASTHVELGLYIEGIRM